MTDNVQKNLSILTDISFISLEYPYFHGLISQRKNIIPDASWV